MSPPIRLTNQAASEHRASAAQNGYITDPYIQLLTPIQAHKGPIINRGTWTRWKGIEEMWEKFKSICKLCSYIHTEDDGGREYLRIVEGGEKQKKQG